MPASSTNLYRMQDAKNNFEALRPAPLCSETNMFMNQCQNIHVSTNCYYGYHDQKSLNNISENSDCEMVEMSHGDSKVTPSPQALSNARKRSAEDSLYTKNKRLREEIQIKKIFEPETIEKKKHEPSSEDSLEHLYWNLHGGNFFHLFEHL